MTPAQIVRHGKLDRRGDHLWTYYPTQHKNAHREGDGYQRAIKLGGRELRIVRRLIEGRAPNEPLINRDGDIHLSGRGKDLKGAFTAEALCRRLKTACKHAGIDEWTPAAPGSPATRR